MNLYTQKPYNVCLNPFKESKRRMLKSKKKDLLRKDEERESVLLSLDSKRQEFEDGNRVLN